MKVKALLSLLVAAVLAVTGAVAPAFADAPSSNIVGATVSRDAATGNFVWSATVQASYTAGLGTGNICSYYASCSFVLQATLVSGGTVLLNAVGLPLGLPPTTGNPNGERAETFSQTLTGSQMMGQVAFLSTQIVQYGASATYATSSNYNVTDMVPAPALSITSISTGRDATTGNFTWNVSTSESYYAMPGTTCYNFNGCTAYLVANLVGGGTATLQSVNIATINSAYVGPNYPQTTNFTGNHSEPKIASVYVYLLGYQGSASHEITSAVSAVGDNVPSPNLSITSISTGRDTTTGNFTWNVSTSESYYAMQGTTCYNYYGCTAYLVANLVGGGTATLQSMNIAAPNTNLQGPNYPQTTNFTGNYAEPKVASVYVYLLGYQGSASNEITSATTVVNDGVPSPSLSFGAMSTGRLSNGNFAWDITTSESYYAMFGNSCYDYYGCTAKLVANLVGGGTATLQNIQIATPNANYQGPSYPQVTHFTGNSAELTVLSVYVDLIGYGAPASGEYQSATMPTNDVSLAEFRAGSNPSEKSCGCSHGDPVDAGSGQFYLNSTDIAIAGSGPALDVSRSYSSEIASANGPFGYGWSTNFGASLSVVTAGSGPLPQVVEVTQENGSTVQFTLNSSSQYSAPPRVLATLVLDTITGSWTFTRQSKQVLVFGTNGSLTSMSDLHGNSIVYDRNTSGQVTAISASGGRSLRLTWASGHVTKVEDSAGRAVTYAYDSSGNLTGSTDLDGNTTSYGYDSSHYLTSYTKPDGGIITNVYDSSHRVSSQTDPLGRETTFAYSALSTTTTAPDGSETLDSYSAAALVSETRAYGTPLAATTSYTYDMAGNRLTFTDALGRTTTYTYDAAGNELTETDPLGLTTTYTYDSLDDPTSITDPLGRQTTSTFDASGNKLTSTSSGGHEQHWTYNTDGTVATSVDARGKTTSYGYNTAGDLTSTTDPDGRTKSVTYNSAEFPVSSTDPAGKVTTFTVDALGRVLTSTDPNLHTTTNTYDADGNLLSSEDPSDHTSSKAYDLADEITSSTDARGKVTTYAYTAAGLLLGTTDPNSHTITNSYNKLGELTSVEDADSRNTTYTYDADGRKLTTTLPSGDMSSTAYDADGRVTSSTDAKGKVTTTVYDADGELTSSTDPLSRVTSTSYTADGQVHVVTLPDASTETYTYNADGQTTEFTNADGKNTTYSYDEADLLTSKVEPGSLETDYSYNSAGLLHITTNPDGSTLTNSYDNAGQLVRAHSNVSGSTDITYTYNSAGQRASMTDQTGTTSYSYNADGQPTSVENGSGATVGYGYDNAGQMTSIVYPGSDTVTYSYDPAGQMASLTDWSSNQTNFTWTVDGQLATQADQNGVTETRSYDADGQTTGITDTKSATNLAEYTYGYDNAGDITSDGTTDPIGTASHAYAYDPNTQLTTVTAGGTSAAYAASSAGELTAETNGDTLVYNSAQELTSLTPTGGSATSYTYDGNGSRTSSTAAATGGTPSTITSYAYDPEGNLASVTPPGIAASITYTSDGDGLRQTRTTGGTTTDFTWDDSGKLPLLLDDGTYSYIYGPSSAPIAQVADSTGTIQYLQGDLIGSTRLITNASGSTIGTTEYDPYGIRTNHTGTTDTAIGYSGNWTDPTSGLVYLRARDYDPITGQFLTIDPLVDTTDQPYAYVTNDPLAQIDPTGLCGWDPFGCNSLDQSIQTAMDQEYAVIFGNPIDYLTGLGGSFFNRKSSSMPCFGPDNGAFTAGVETLPALLLVASLAAGGGDETITPGIGPKISGDDAVAPKGGAVAPDSVPPPRPNFSKPSESPGKGWEWRGNGAPGTSRGSWFNPSTDESLHPDLGHPGPIGPHFDWVAPDGTQYRIFSDGSVVPKSGKSSN